MVLILRENLQGRAQFLSLQWTQQYPLYLRGLLITVPEIGLINRHSFPSSQCLLMFVWQATKVYHSSPVHMGQTLLSSWYPKNNKRSMEYEKAAFLCACYNTWLSPGDSNVSCLPGINHLGRLVENMKKGNRTWNCLFFSLKLC